MTEAVIVSTARSPDRPGQQGLARRVPARRPDRHHRQGRARQGARSSTARPIEDLILGCGQPAGESGYNIARVAAILAGLRRRPRRHRQPLLLVVAADHPHGRPRHQGRRGRRLRRRRRRDRQPLHAAASPTAARTTRCSPTPRPAPPSAPTAPTRGSRSTACPTSTSPWARPPRTCGSRRTSARQDMDEFAARQPAAGRGQPGERLLGRRDHAHHHAVGHRGHQGRRPPRRHHRREAGRAQAGVPPRRRDHGRQRLPAQRRRRRRRRDERHPRRRAGHHPAGPRRVVGRHGPQPRDHGPRPDRGVAPGPAAGPA